MTKKRLNLLITIVALILYSGNICYQYMSAEYLVGNQFSTETSSELDLMESSFFDDELISVNNLACKMAENSITWSPYCERTYPLSYGIYDKNGVLIEKSGYNFRFNDNYINVDKYINQDFINEFKNSFPNKTLGGVVVSEFDYFEENDKILPTKVSFVDVNNPSKKLNLIFEQPSSDDKKEFTRFYGKLNDDEEYTGSVIDFNFDGFYRDDFNKRIQQKLDKEIEKCTGTLNVNTLGGVSFQNFESSDFSGSGGTSGPESFDYTYFVNINNNGYAVRIISAYSKPYNIMVSAPFVEGVTYTTIMFFVVMLVVYICANKYYDKNKSLNEARRVFTSAAAHELKTPITIINNQCECLIENVAPEKNQEYLSNIYLQNRHMSILVSNLLQYNRIDSTNLEKSNINLHDICIEELEKYSYLIESKNLKVDLCHLLNITIFADEKLIRLVIDNYISNAIKHTSDDNNIIILCNKNRFSVYNKGSYISYEDKNKIWEIFSRATGNEAIESSGMGLAICKKILETHKFKYGFENKNDGVEFYFEY